MIKSIGTILYVVNKSYVNEKLNNGKVYVTRIKSYENVSGEILPILKEVGSSKTFFTTSFYTYDTLLEAVQAIDVKNTLVVKEVLSLEEVKMRDGFKENINNQLKKSKENEKRSTTSKSKSTRKL